jgi:phage-related protein
MFDDKNNPTSDPLKDICAKSLTACKLRFGNNPLSFWGFPGARE